MSVMSRFLRAFAANESGATAVEYGLIVGLIFLAIVAAVQAAGDATEQVYTVIANAIAG